MLFKQKANQQILILGAILLLSALFCFLTINIGQTAWLGPQDDPPNRNVPRPLNKDTQFVGDNGFISGTLGFTEPNTLNLKVLGCAEGEIIISSSTGSWECSSSTGDLLNSFDCDDGEILVYNGLGWVCGYIEQGDTINNNSTVVNVTPSLLGVLNRGADASAFVGGVNIGTTSVTWLNLGGALTAGWLHATSTIGTSVINHDLQIRGKIKIMGGTPGVGKVLVATSSDGLAEWVTSTNILAGLPTGIINQTLRHNGTGWVASSSLLVMATSGVAIANDLFMASGKAIRVDGAGTTNLYIGNWYTDVAGLMDVNVYGNINIGENYTYRQGGQDVIRIAKNGDDQYSSVYVGAAAGSLSTSSQQIAIGYFAGNNNKGNKQIALGSSAGAGNSGTNQIAIGDKAGINNQGFYQIVIGNNAGQQNTGNNTVAIGHESGNGNTGNDVVAIGYKSGQGNALNNQFIVQQAINNQIRIPLIQGDFFSGNVGIGTTTPNSASRLHIYKEEGNAEIAIQRVPGFNNHWAIYNDVYNVLKFWRGDDVLELRGSSTKAGTKVEIKGELCLGGTCKSSWDVGSVYVGKTAGSHDGNPGSYAEADVLCNGFLGGSHVCSNEEIIKSMRDGVPMSGNAWVNSGATAGSNDCAGWTSNTSEYKAAFWQLDNKNSKGWITGCNTSLPFACCK